MSALSLLGYPCSFDALIEKFEKDTHFQCFSFEQNPSFCANCNVLLAFIHSSHPERYVDQIGKCVRYICYEWWNSDGPIRDHWVCALVISLIQNLSHYYPMMLASQSLIRLLDLYENRIIDLPKKLLQIKVMIVLFQILVRTLQQQNEDGSWGSRGSREETAYAIITLSNLDSLPFVTPIAGQIESSISRGRKFLKSMNALENVPLTSRDYIWIGKVSYGVENVCHSYVLAALNAPVPQFILGPRVAELVKIPTKRITNFSKFYSRLPMFTNVEGWKLKAWLMEGYLFLPDLQAMRLDIFHRRGRGDDTYSEYLPFSWTAPCGLEKIDAGAQTLFDMMVLSLVNYQVDEFFDEIVSKGDLYTLSQIRKMINKLFTGLRVSPTRDIVNGIETLSEEDREIYHRLDDFLQFVVTYPRIQNASVNDKAWLQLELKSYLLAHTQQCEDSIKLRRQAWQKTYATPPSSYMKWVRTTASDHLSSQYVFAFLTCLLGNGEDYLGPPEVKYIAQDCCTHLSVICRMFNDYGSLERDRTDCNLNSSCFPEFDAGEKSENSIRAEIVRLTTYERKCLSLAFDELKRVCGTRYRRVYDIARLFYNASEIYTEVYEVREFN